MVVYSEYNRSGIYNIISTSPEIITHIVKTNIKREEFVNLIFEICENCKAKAMAAIPPSMFTAKKIREARDMKVSNITTREESSKYYRTKFMELNPVKYNSKLMNSIWGFYNRYSSHNVKKNNDVTIIPSAELQQSAVNSANTESFRSLSPSTLDNVFVTISLPQSN